MPYYRKRRSYGRRYNRRYTNKRRRMPVRRTKRPKVTAYAIAKATQPTRKYVMEHTDILKNVNNDLPHLWQALCCNADIPMIEAALSADGPGGVDLGSITSANSVYRVTNMNTRIVLRNTTNHTCLIRMYVCVARNDCDKQTATDSLVYAMRHLIDGWDHLVDDALVTTAGTGTIVNFSAGNAFALAGMRYLNPYKSDVFCQNWKIEEARSGRLNAGDDFVTTLRSSKFDYNYYDVNPSIEDKLQIIGGVTRIALLSVSGSLGKATDDTVAGFVDSILSMHCTHTANVLDLHWTEKAIGLVNNNESTSGKTIEAPQDITSVATEGA